MTKKRRPEPADLNTDPKSKHFLRGASFERKARILRHVAPDRYVGLVMLLDATLREEFTAIGPKPSDVRNGV